MAGNAQRSNSRQQKYSGEKSCRDVTHPRKSLGGLACVPTLRSPRADTVPSWRRRGLKGACHVSGIDGFDVLRCEFELQGRNRVTNMLGPGRPENRRRDAAPSVQPWTLSCRASLPRPGPHQAHAGFVRGARRNPRPYGDRTRQRPQFSAWWRETCNVGIFGSCAPGSRPRETSTCSFAKKMDA